MKVEVDGNAVVRNGPPLLKAERNPVASCNRKPDERAKEMKKLILAFFLLTASGSVVAGKASDIIREAKTQGLVPPTYQTAPNSVAPRQAQLPRQTKQFDDGGITLATRVSRSGFDSILMADFTLTNGTEHEIRDITVKCFHYAPSGTQIDSNIRTIYEVFPPHSRKVVPEFNMGFVHSQVQRTECKIHKIPGLTFSE